ncbi:MAG: sigma 54-interacting transcriptional regulator [Nitrospiraceae bacterium]|nr:sigma 54-interacting transcriptional regulator [Nitrospiraceae bacterium]
MKTGDFFLITADSSFISLFTEKVAPFGFGFELRDCVPSGPKMRRASFAERPLIIDLNLPGSMEALKSLKAYHPECRILVLSNGDPKKTEEALRSGAKFVIFERNDAEAVRETAQRARAEAEREYQLEKLKSLTEQKIIAKSAAMKKALGSADDAAGKAGHILLNGEPGAGRETLAAFIHENSGGFNSSPFIKVVSEDLIDAAVRQARGGTLFIKEAAIFGQDTAERLKLLLTEGVWGGNGAGREKAELRVIIGCSSSPEPAWLQQARIARIKLPPLRDRQEDILPLAECFMEELSLFFHLGRKHLTQKAKQALAARPFPGNVAELKQLIHRAYMLSKGLSIGEKDLFGSEFLGRCSLGDFIEERLRGYIRKSSDAGGSRIYDTVITEVEKALVSLALRETAGNKLKAAKALGLSRNTFKAKMRLFKLEDKFTSKNGGR